MHHLIRTTVVAALAALALAAPAQAHVSAQPAEQPAGGFTVVTMRVPNERPEATTKVEVQFPAGVSGARIKPVPGWTAKVNMEQLDEPMDDGHGGEVTEQVASIVWTGGEIQEGQFEDFPVSLQMVHEGELGDLVFFPAIQTYEGGEEVAWTEKPTSEDDDTELERPAPKVTLVDAGDGHGAGGGDDDGGSSGELQDDVDSARTLAVIGIVLGALGMLFGFLGMRRRS